VKTGHPTGFWFFFWGEFAERCSYYGMRAILALYMTDALGFSKADSGTFMSLFIAACYFLPLLGGYLADNYFGKYWTIVGFSIPYVLGQFMVGFPNQYVLFGSLVLLAMGSGVIKPNISTLMGLTYDQQRPGQEKLRTSAFSWFYLSINIGAALSQFLLPAVRDAHGYRVAFLVPAFFMAFALCIFALGKPYYAKEVVGQAKHLTPEEKTERWRVFGRIALLFVLVMFFWAIFDQSASTWIFFADTYMDTTLAGVNEAGATVLFSGDTVYSMTNAGAKVVSPIAELFGAKPLKGVHSIAPSADAIQAFNALFIVMLLPLVLLFWKTLDRKGIKVRATDKMIAGFTLTGVTMLIMAFAGFNAGKKEDGLKIAFKGGEIVLPMNQLHVGGSSVTLGSDNLEFSDGAIYYGETIRFGNLFSLRVPQAFVVIPKGKVAKGGVSFKEGQILLPDNRVLAFADGKLDFVNSRGLFDGGKIDLGYGVRWRFKDGEYARGDDTIVIDEGQVTVKESQKPEAGKPDKDPSITISTVEYVAPQEQVSVWWQVLAYLILTIAEILISVTGLELAFVAAPKSMTSFVTACWLLTVALANLLINAPISRLYPIMDPALYFILLAVAMGIVILLFLKVAKRFNRAMDEKARVAEAAGEAT
jgi:POT family proton-dependent oligopeptide transporter